MSFKYYQIRRPHFGLSPSDPQNRKSRFGCDFLASHKAGSANPDPLPLPGGLFDAALPFLSLPGMSPLLAPQPSPSTSPSKAGHMGVPSTVTTNLYGFWSTSEFQSKHHPCPLNCPYVPHIPKQDWHYFLAPDQSPMGPVLPRASWLSVPASQEYPDPSGPDIFPTGGLSAPTS